MSELTNSQRRAEQEKDDDLWNEHDPILKERFFGLTNSQGNHAEDVKEYYFYLDGPPTHFYMKMLYKYPQVAFPYDVLVEDKLRLLTAVKKSCDSAVTTVFVRQGYYALDPQSLAAYPAADISLNRISDLLQYDLTTLLNLRNLKRGHDE